MHANITRRLFMAGSSASVLMMSHVLRASAQESIDEVRWALPAVNDTMFVPRAWSTYVGAIMSLVQEGLLGFGDDLSLQPAVAESWKQPDNVTYVYTLRHGVTFGDGTPLTAEDVVASFLYQMNPKSASQLAAFFSSVDTVTATGDNEVTVKLKAPNVQFQYTPAHMAGFLFSKKQLEEFPEDIGTPDAQIGRAHV